MFDTFSATLFNTTFSFTRNWLVETDLTLEEQAAVDQWLEYNVTQVVHCGPGQQSVQVLQVRQLGVISDFYQFMVTSTSKMHCGACTFRLSIPVFWNNLPWWVSPSKLIFPLCTSSID